jgi:predicted extracellular nuclease
MKKHLNKMFSMMTILALMMMALPMQRAQASPTLFANPTTTVFINEIHYDNASTDAGEAIEVAGPAGTSLTGWSLVLYNGSGGAVYATIALSGVIANQQGGYGTLSFAAVGLQNGSPDGIALVNGTTLVQFLSYEGTFTAVGGVANGVPSTDIGVSQAGSEPLGSSLQLTGTGETYGEFTWTATTANTFGNPNAGQTFSADSPVIASCGGPLTTDESTPASANVSASDADGTVIDIQISNITPSPAPGAISLSDLIPAGGVGGTATVTANVDALVPAGNYSVQITATNNDDTPQTGTCNLTVVVNAPPPPSPMIINELDSDTPGTDAAEFVELYDGGLGNTDLTGLVLVFYNGNGDVSYAAFDLDGRSTNAAGYFVLGNSGVTPTPDLTFTNGTLQNGEDAVALYRGDAADFPNGTPVTTLDLIDALVYDTGDPNDPGLLVLLNTGQPQVDENGGGNSADQSNQRCPNGNGGQRNTDTYLQNTPSASATNNCGLTLTIMQIQDAAHRSPYEGELVRDVPGIVTALRSNGFYMQDTSGDADIVTSDGIFVFTDIVPTVSVGQALLVRGNVSEFRPGGSDGAANLTITELTSPFITVVSSGNSLPSPTLIGAAGRVPPNMIIDDDPGSDVETSGSFDVTTDGIDFYESMEGMLVQVNNPVVVGPTNGFGEIFVLADDGTNPGAGLRTVRGGIVIQSNDFNPERIQIDDAIANTPDANVGDHFTGPAVGVLDYSFGNFEILVTEPLTVVSGGLAREVTTAADDVHFAVGTMNVENLDPNDPAEKFNELAGLIVNNLQSPDILALEEVQDNNGATNDSVVDATDTYNELIAAIISAGGPTYQFRQINPVDDQDGGEPGGNIRVGFLFRTDRGLSFIDRPGADSLTPNAVVGNGANTRLQFSPGRIDPTNQAFNANESLDYSNSRKPLAAEFTFRGHHLFVIANHFSSKGGDDPLFGRFQPPTLFSETQRNDQAQVVHNFVDDLLAADPNANVIVLGDLNDFEFSNPLTALKGSPQILHALIEELAPAERYSYVFEGNSQALDHILLTKNLFGTPFGYDIVHVNSEFAAQASDHEPQVVRLLSYEFTGFFSPVDNLPVFNQVKAGQSIPIKFSLKGDQGLNILADSYPTSTDISCSATDPVDGIEETVTAGSSSLSYDPSTDTYTYVWKTNKSWANTCRQFVLKLNDGTFHQANFNFTK